VRALWHQVCVALRVELTGEVSNAVRELLAPCGDTLVRVPGSDRHAAASLLEAAGIALANPVDAARGPVRFEAGRKGNLALVVDAAASDVPVVATWRPNVLPAGSAVLAQAGLAGTVPVTGLLDSCSRWLERLTAAAGDVAGEPFEARILAWPIARNADGRQHIVERYLAGGPGAQEHARTLAAQRQAQIALAGAPGRQPGAFGAGSAGARALQVFLGDRAATHAQHGLQDGEQTADLCQERAAA
jgi:hypothetical protein